MAYWLMKSEPDCFSIDDLNQRDNKTAPWDGVRNYQARNMLKREMKQGDFCFFYHSSCQPPGIAGIVEVVKEGYPDYTAWHSDSDHYDPKSTPEQPIWYMVDVKLVKKFPQLITLQRLKTIPALCDMIILRKGNRLSITPLKKSEWDIICKLT